MGRSVGVDSGRQGSAVRQADGRKEARAGAGGGWGRGAAVRWASGRGGEGESAWQVRDRRSAQESGRREVRAGATGRRVGISGSAGERPREVRAGAAGGSG